MCKTPKLEAAGNSVLLYTSNNNSPTELSLVVTGKNSPNGLFLTVSKAWSVLAANLRTGSDARTSRSWPRVQATLHNLATGAGISMNWARAKTCRLCSESFVHKRKNLAVLLTVVFPSSVIFSNSTIVLRTMLEVVSLCFPISNTQPNEKKL